LASKLEELLALQIEADGLPVPEREWRFAAPRRWRFDFAYPDRKVAVEVEGGVWNGGRHTRGAGFEADCEKYTEALCRGWKVLRVGPSMVKGGQAIQALKTLLRPSKGSCSGCSCRSGSGG
jgi:very-short-patch-repair endonuclease